MTIEMINEKFGRVCRGLLTSKKTADWGLTSIRQFY